MTSLNASSAPAIRQRSPFLALTRWLAAVVLGMALAACATGPKLVNHSFSFSGLNDGWMNSVALLAYAYGDQYYRVRNDIDKPRSGVFAGKDRLPPGDGVSGPMPVGDFLYVKWRFLETGEILESKVDLKGRLPADMTDHELTFVIDGRQLHVFVVTPERKKTYGEPPVLMTWRSNFAKTYEIYPSAPAQ
ncbi:MAG TPA: hypothetical protein VIN35_15105 [Hydrogenophaga sp.]